MDWTPCFWQQMAVTTIISHVMLGNRKELLFQTERICEPIFPDLQMLAECPGQQLLRWLQRTLVLMRAPFGKVQPTSQLMMHPAFSTLCSMVAARQHGFRAPTHHCTAARLFLRALGPAISPESILVDVLMEPHLLCSRNLASAALEPTQGQLGYCLECFFVFQNFGVRLQHHTNCRCSGKGGFLHF